MQLYMHNMGEVEVEVQQLRKVARVEPRPLGECRMWCNISPVQGCWFRISDKL